MNGRTVQVKTLKTARLGVCIASAFVFIVSVSIFAQAHPLRVMSMTEAASILADDYSTRPGLKTLYVGNLPMGISEDEVRPIFEKFGKLQRLALMKHQDTGETRGYGFVEYAVL